MFVASSVRNPLWARENVTGASSSRQLPLGVDYYPDQTPDALSEKDARMMAEVGFTNVRIAEFAWVLMEPAEGEYEFG